MFIPNGSGEGCDCKYRPVPVGISFNRNSDGSIKLTPELFAHSHFLLCCYKCNCCLGNTNEEAKRIIFGGKKE